MRDRLSRETILKELELHRNFEATKASLISANEKKLKTIEDENLELKKSNSALCEDLETKVTTTKVTYLRAFANW